MKKVLFVLLLFVVALAVLPTFLPKTMHVEEEYVFDAPIEKVYNHFNDLQKFTQFDAWSKKDSTIILTFSSPANGEDASYQFKSNNKKVGDGSLKIISTKINEFINYEMNFGDINGNTSEVIFQRMEDDKTRVVWSFDSDDAKYPFQIFNLLMKGSAKENLKKSLENLDVILQKPIQLNYANLDVEKGGFQIIEQGPKKLFGVLQQTSVDDEEMETAMAETFGLVRSYLVDAHGLSVEELGKPVILWKQFDDENNMALFYCGFILEKIVPEEGDLEYTNIPGGKFLTTFHNGAHRTLDISYNRMRTFADVQELELSNDTYDVYYNDADTTDEKDLRTQIFIPILN